MSASCHDVQARLHQGHPATDEDRAHLERCETCRQHLAAIALLTPLPDDDEALDAWTASRQDRWLQVARSRSAAVALDSPAPPLRVPPTQHQTLRPWTLRRLAGPGLLGLGFMAAAGTAAVLLLPRPAPVYPDAAIADARRWVNSAQALGEASSAGTAAAVWTEVRARRQATLLDELQDAAVHDAHLQAAAEVRAALAMATEADREAHRIHEYVEDLRDARDEASAVTARAIRSASGPR